jgi:hypothetical protein
LTCLLGLTRVTAAAFRTVVPRSLTLVSEGVNIVNTPLRAVDHFRELTENDLISFLPHLGNERLARINDASESVTRDSSEPSILKGTTGPRTGL